MSRHTVAPAPTLRDAFTALGTARGRQDPYPLYEAIRSHGDTAWLKPGRLVVVGYEECDRALRDTRLHVQDAAGYDATSPGWRDHSSLRAFTSSMLYSNPPDHARLRAVAGFAFAPPKIRRLRSVIEGMADRLLDRMAALGVGGSPVDLIAEFASRLPVAVISALLGFPEEDQVWFRDMASTVAVSTDGFGDPAALERADRAMDEMTAYFTELVDRRRRDPHDDLVTLLTRVHDGDPRRLGHDELMGTLMVLLTAGFETTSFLIGHGAMLALERTAFAGRLRAESDFAPRYVEEILRFEPPVHVTSRRAATDTELLGAPVPAGTRLTLILAAANRDPRRFADPGRFDPDRPDNRPLSFGAGGHFCLGAPLARLEAQIALPRLFARFPRLAATEPPVYRDRWVVRGLDTFAVAVAG
ncbi:cytochrome P450 [Streptomyces tirandamycinicus]|uniref:Cytochrome P450 n=1 Tax=Streptomyces tirandamycinicus TaxID=2174846 RepID=A0A2S1T299_9ACTN|nr:cytochrome P450 [Streptomyces tirandamycinicus]AWI32804.1 cytochrome P450 [Streptomyces tirandamycinicus]